MRRFFYVSMLLWLASHLAQAQTPLNWQPRTDLNTLLPPSVQIYEANDTLGATPVIAMYATIDLSDNNLELKAVGGEGNFQTVEEYAEDNDAIFAVNGGFFSSTESVSLIVEDGVKIAPNILSLVRNDTTYFPTRGAFGLINRQPDVAWVYDVPSGFEGVNLTYQYPQPADNSVDNPPLPQPSASFPEGGTPWPVSQAIGGLPVLVQNGAIQVTAEEELIDSEAFVGPNPRTAIGYREDNTIIVLVVEGRQAGSAGTTLQETAEIMLSLGAVEAVNLDGGGSTTMVAADEVVNIPVDVNGGDRNRLRTVGSALVVREKNPTPQEEVTILDTEGDYYTEVGLWSDSKTANFYGTSASRSTPAGEGNFLARYDLDSVSEGRYQLAAWWTVDTARNADNVPYILHRDDQVDTLLVDQSERTNAGQWNVLGEYELDEDDYLEIRNDADGSKVVVDAIRLIRLSDAKTEVRRGDVRLSFVNDINASFGTVGYEPRVDSAVARLTREYQPDFVYGIGDLIAGQSASLSREQIEAMWQGFKEDIYQPFQQAGIPFGFTFGNHDASLDLDRTIAEEFWEANKPDLDYVDDTNYPFYYSFTQDEGNIFIASLDAGGANFADSTVRAWLRETLASPEAQNAEYRFVGGHLPIFGVSQGRDTPGNILNNPDEWLDIFEEYGVHTYLAGHHAAYYPGKRRGTDLFTGGEMGGGARIYVGTDQTAPYTLTLMDIFYEEDTIVYTTYNIGEFTAPEWPTVEYEALPEVIFGINGFVLRRDINLTNQGQSTLSSINLPQAQAGQGRGTATVMVQGDSLRISGSFSDLESPLLEARDAIAIYRGRNTEVGTPLATLLFTTSDGRNGTFQGTIAASAELEELIAVGGLYINLRTRQHPEGALRGQIYSTTNTAPPAVPITSQPERNTYAVRNIEAFYEIDWEEPAETSDPVSFLYQLAYDSAFTQIVYQKGTGQVSNVKLLEKDLYRYLGDAEENEPVTLYHRVVVTDGSEITYSPAQKFMLIKSNLPLEDLVEVPAPNYVFNDIIRSEGFGGTGVTIDGQGNIWTSLFRGGIRVYRPDGTEADISPIPYMVLENGDSLRTEDGTVWSTNFGYGLATDPDGNVLMGKGGKMAKFNSQTGKVIAHWDAPFTVLSPETDSLGFVYAAGLFERDNIVYKLAISDSDPTYYEVVQEIDVTGRPFTREFAASPDGQELYFPSNGSPFIAVFVSTDDGQTYQQIESITSVAAGSNAVEVPQDSVLYATVRPGGNLPTTLHYRNEKAKRSWTLELPGIADDNRGMAVSPSGDTIVTSGWSDGTFRRYVLNGEGVVAERKALDYTITNVRGVNEQGVADSLGVYARLEGVVNSTNYGSSTLNFFMTDGQFGINVFNYADSLSADFEIGDRVAVYGEVVQNFGQISVQADSVQLLERTARRITAVSIEDALTDALESSIVQLDHARLVDAQQWTTGQGYLGFYVDVQQDDQTYRVFISKYSDLYQQPAPQGLFSLTGVVVQQDETAPYTDQYAIWPRTQDDLQEVDTPRILSFTLINTENSQDVRTLRAGDVIDYSTLGTQEINIRANVDPRKVERVEFTLNGALFATERILPYALGGDFPGQNRYKPLSLDTGDYTLTAIPYARKVGYGEPLTINFTIVGSVEDSVASAPAARRSESPEIKMTANAVSVYPIPARNRLNVRFAKPIAASLQLVMTDMTGRQYQVYQMQRGEQSTTLNLEGQKKGIYLLRFVSAQGTQVRRIVVE